MSLLKEAMSGGKTLKKIHVSAVRCNEENHYHIEKVKELAELIEKNGVNSGVAYFEEKEDKKHYTLIGGERRYRALCLLLKEGKGDGLYPLSIIPKPKNEWEEKLAIIQDNFQREKNRDDQKKEVEMLAEIYTELKKQNPSPIPVGTLKRDWIASQTTIGRITVQKYLTGEYSDNKKDTVKKVNVELSEEEQKQQFFCQELKRCMEHKLGTKVVFSKNKFSISFNNTKDLNRILEELGLDNVVNDSKYV